VDGASDLKQIIKAADLAHLELSLAEKEKFSQQLSQILNYFKQLEEVNTESVEPLLNPSDMIFVARDDVVKARVEDPEGILGLAPERQGNLYKVPPVV